MSAQDGQTATGAVAGASTTGAPATGVPATGSKAVGPATRDGFPVPPALRRLRNQPRVLEFFCAALAEDRLSHAYLLVGAPGAGMQEAAQALAECVVCPAGGDDTCDECIRVRHHTHPDVHFIDPGSVTGYLVSQVRDIIADTSLAPVRARSKVYVLSNAGLLRGAAANALLKTIEEPPAGVMFILVARSVEVVLPTIVSRCQQVPFRVVAPDAAQREVVELSGADQAQAREALSVAGTPERAAEFLKSPGRREVRRMMVRTLGELERDDSWDVLKSADQLVEAMRSPLEDVRQRQKEDGQKSADYLSAKAMKELEDAHKRELTALERSGIMEGLAAARSFLRDVLMRCTDPAADPVNEDVVDVVERVAASTTTSGALAALDAVERAAGDLSHNVTATLVVETMLLRIKEALECPPSSR